MQQESHQRPLSSQLWVDHQTYNYEHLILHSNRISTQFHTAFAFSALPIKGTFKFGFTIQQISEYIGIGISDTLNISKERMTQNYVCYFSGGKYFANQKLHLCQPFTNKDTVFLQGNLATNQIEIKIKDKTEIIKVDKKGVLQWVPFVELKKGCTVSIIESFPDASLNLIDLAISWFKWDFDICYEIHNLICFMKQEEKE